MTWSKESRQSRGYGAAWDKLRKIVMARDFGMCQCGECRGGKFRVTRANEVDHIIPKAKGGTDDLSNLRAVSTACHKRITAEQMGIKVRSAIGVDGWPID